MFKLVLILNLIEIVLVFVAKSDFVIVFGRSQRVLVFESKARIVLVFVVNAKTMIEFVSKPCIVRFLVETTFLLVFE